ncbi:MAG TPA: bifunctional biotin--[acetyl-CoA-carboxylase] ligase/biotin operon repressor BirA [Sedimenticola sp.]|nr:bifunctional biotin--[acetyl-CoA-carboxylase] ligase/biotin operon repressor BirA [Sedimenticola sp.]
MERAGQILRALADGQFHSGEELARRLGISRAAVWKQVARIRTTMGLPVQAVQGRGYRLSEPLELLDPEAIRDAILPGARGLLAELEVLDRIDSTNSHLMRRIDDGIDSGHACLCEWQTAGRGRRGRPWISPFGSNIYLSLYWSFPQAAAELAGLSLVAGVNVVQGLERLGITGVALKWPNDLLWEGRKLAGLLLEMRGEQGGECRVVTGVGLNTRLRDDVGEAIDQPWIDLHRLPGGQGLSRNRIAASVLGALLEGMARFQEQGFEPFRESWCRYDRYLGRPVTLTLGSRRVMGIHRGVDYNGALLLQTTEGVRSYHGGEVSLRGKD